MSSLPSDLPKLPKWPFFLFDAVLLVTAFTIAWHHPGQLTGMSLYAVSACVMLAAIMCAVPLLFDYTRAQDEALDERQRALEALSRTVATSAEQIGIAAQGLFEIAENTNRCLKQAEHLPQKLQEKIAELQVRIDTARDEEIEELEREVTTLRSSDAEKLESASDKIHKASVELSKLEASAAKHLSTASEVFSKAEALADKAAHRFAQSADESAARVGSALARTIASAQQSTQTALSSEQERVLAAISSKLDSAFVALDTRSTQAAGTIDQKIALLEAVVANLKAAVAEASRIPIPRVSELPGVGAVEPQLAEAAHAKRSRKTRRDEAASVDENSTEPAPEPAPTTAATPEPQPEVIVAVVSPVESKPEHSESAAPEPASSVIPVVETQVAEPALAEPAEAVNEELQKAVSESIPETASQPPSEDSSEYTQVSPEETATVASVSVDGATRLIVTAYIGIGNRLYIRGEGPGLSWDKGLPLQFVSIGKWRWESADATSPVRIKLLKNDQIECPTLGELMLAPGHQAEVAANF